MLTIWRRAETFDRTRASAGTWIFTLARNRSIDAFRRERRPEVSEDDPTLVPEPPAQADADLQMTQDRDRLTAAIKKLPREQSDLIALAYYGDKTHTEIAAETGLPLGTVKSRLRLALARLRLVFEETEQ